MSNDSVGDVLEKHWSDLPIFKRVLLLVAIGIDGKNENFLAGKTMDEVIQCGQDDLPSEIRSRLIMAVTPEGFSVAEYNRVKESLRGRVERIY